MTGNRVFLRHYCVSLAGPDAVRAREPFAGDVRAARGFNGDIGICLARWRAGDAAPRRVARKSLFAAAGIVSVRNKTWTTDRASAAHAWERIAKHEHQDMCRLLSWADGSLEAAPGDLDVALSPSGIVSAVAERFAAEIGLWG